MDFSYDNEQTALREAVSGLLAKAYGGDQRRSVTTSEPGFDETTWGRLAEMGVLGLPFAEEDGGMGAGPVEVGMVATELGKVLAPEPFVETVVLAGGLIAGLGTPEQRTELLTGIAEGASIVVFAHAEPGARWSPSAASVTATSGADGWTLTGVKEPVPHGARADQFVVSAVADGETRLFVVGGDAEGVARTGYRTHDGGRAAKVEFTGAKAELLGEAPGDRTADIEQALATARIAYANESVGAMDTALTMTSEYLTSRKQFGVTLNKFQALTFRAADMYVSLELARSIALWATMVVADDAAGGSGDVVQAADRARLTTSRAGRHIGKEAIQLHGGIGVTAEYKVGHYTSRLTAIDHQLGDGNWALSRLAAGVGSYESVEPLA